LKLPLGEYQNTKARDSVDTIAHEGTVHGHRLLGVAPGEDREMDFIERIFGFSPDGGSGAFEFLLFLVPVVGIVLLRWRARRRSRKD